MKKKTENEMLHVSGVGRDADDERTLFMSLNRKPTDDEVRAIHDFLRRVEPHSLRGLDDGTFYHGVIRQMPVVDVEMDCAGTKFRGRGLMTGTGSLRFVGPIAQLKPNGEWVIGYAKETANDNDS